MVAAPRLASSQWTAFPDNSGTHKSQVTVNIEEKAEQKQAARRHFGMTAKEARADLGGYFDSIDHQVKKQERQRAQQLLHALSMTGGHHAASSHEYSPDTLAARKAHSLMKLVKKAETGKDSALIRLVQRAAHSQLFQRALVGAAEGKYRRSLAGTL